MGNLPQQEERLAVWMEEEVICLIDQRQLPHRSEVLRLATYPETVEAIRDMAVRGAGTIGVAAGFAMAQAVLTAPNQNFWEEIAQAADRIREARPTAKNLFYAVDRVLGAIQGTRDPEVVRRKAVIEAQAIHDDDVGMTEVIARVGANLIPKEKAILTHCNAGWLAYAGWGTALAPIYWAHRGGQPVFVYATETRPRGQGAKLTAWELSQAGVPHKLVADTAAGSLFAQDKIGMVIVGADRIAANGDTANKIGTYTLSVLAKHHGVGFYVAAPSPTFDAECPSGQEIPIEEREPQEVLYAQGVLSSGEAASVRVAAPGVQVSNPAFDVTPADQITAFLTEHGVIEPTPKTITTFLSKAKEARGNRHVPSA